MKSEKLNEKVKSIESLMNQISFEVKDYLISIKEESVNEIMNGSIQRAQELLDNILPIQASAENLSNVHLSFLQILLHKKNFAKPELRIITPIKSSETKSFESNPLVRSNILKALIYLGGNADLKEVTDFVKRESSKSGLLLEKEKQIFSDNEKLLKVITEESYLMLKEGLVIEDNLSKKWEILSAGIEALSKSDISAKAN